MTAKPYILKETNWKYVKESQYDFAVLPWGATEAHNYHLPFGTDIFESEAVAAESARLAWEKGVKPVVLPAVPFGANNQQLDIALTINMSPRTQAVVLTDIVESLEGYGLNKLVILNGHGGNDFKFIIRELQQKHEVFLCAVNWFAIPEPPGLFAEQGDHANEMETSLMLHLVPDLILPLEEAGDGKSKQPKIKALREKWAWAPRQWTKVTEDTGIGNPKQATSEKGATYFKHITTEISEFFVELARTDVNNLYE
ncbi:creatininase family protein [candidate division KSB1 bacterium]|nr:creatininase family protein [candidate division KSB1 bacterium]